MLSGAGYRRLCGFAGRPARARVRLGKGRCRPGCHGAAYVACQGWHSTHLYRRSGRTDRRVHIPSRYRQNDRVRHRGRSCPCPRRRRDAEPSGRFGGAGARLRRGKLQDRGARGRRGSRRGILYPFRSRRDDFRSPFGTHVLVQQSHRGLSRLRGLRQSDRNRRGARRTGQNQKHLRRCDCRLAGRHHEVVEGATGGFRP